MRFTRSIAATAAALALTVGTAQAQTINFGTAGAFSGSGCTAVGVVAGVSAFCDAVGGIRLTYNFSAQQVLNGFGNAQFGSFQTSGTGSTALNVAPNFTSVLFALSVNQTLPSVGGVVLSSMLSGTVSMIQGGLVWGPISPTTFNIGTTNYTLSTDALTSGVRIDPPGVGGIASDPQTIRGFVTTVPEPSTYLLMASGLAAIGLISRRRRSV